MVDKNARRESRIIAIKTLFSFLARDQKIPFKETFDHVLDESEQLSDDFAESLLSTTIENLGKLKVVLHALAPEFTFEKIAPMNRSLLLLGLAEMKYFDTPPIVIINEYIELGKLFGESRSAGFINGVLDAFRKNIGRERTNDDNEEA